MFNQLKPMIKKILKVVVIVLALAFVVINLLVDLTYTFLDPRIRYA